MILVELLKYEKKYIHIYLYIYIYESESGQAGLLWGHLLLLTIVFYLSYFYQNIYIFYNFVLFGLIFDININL